MSDVSPAGFKLLLDYEVGGGEAYYNKMLARPTWPEGQSGVTIGIGYDLGYTPRERFLADFAKLDDDDRMRLAATIGVKGPKAKDRADRLQDIVIPWPLALEVFERRTIPYWVEQTKRAFPNSDKLPWDAFSGLVSLVFNRGPALKGRDREDMMDIYKILADGVDQGDLQKIAKEIREMKRIWRRKGLKGLVKRREAEAQLIENAK